MPAPSATWTVRRVFITYRNRLSGLMEGGNWVASATGRIVNTLGDGSRQVFRPGQFASGALNVTESLPSLSVELPVIDDPDNLPQGGEIVLKITFTNGDVETFHLQPSEDWDADGTDLALIIDPTVDPVAPPVNFAGVPGGLARLDADGDVIDADGVKVVSGGGSSFTNYSQVVALTGYPAVIAAGADQAAARTAIDAASATTLTGHTGNTSNPHGVTKAQVGLGNADNTADTAKPVSTAQQTALDAKAPLASPAFTGTPTGITKAHVGLGNVDNTSDANKPVSTAQQTALDGKSATSHSHTLDGLSDVTITSPSNSQVLKYNGSIWVNDTDAGGGGATNLTATLSATQTVINSDTGTDATIPAADGTNAGVMTAAQQTKLAGIATAATANAPDAQLRDRSTHTGSDPVSAIAATATARIFGRNTAGAGAGEELTAAQVRTMINVADGATANATDAQLRDRSTHTGTIVSTVMSDFAEAVDDRVDALVADGTGIVTTYNDAGNALTVDVINDIPFVLSHNGTNWVNKAGATISARIGTRPVILQGGTEAQRPAWANQLGDEHNAVG